MGISKNDLMDFVNTASVKQVRDFAKVMCAMMKKEQLAILSKMFKKRMAFEMPAQKEPAQEPERKAEPQPIEPAPVPDELEGMPAPPKEPFPDLPPEFADEDLEGQ